MGKAVIAVVVIVVIVVGGLSLTGTDIPFRAGTGGVTTPATLTTVEQIISEGGQIYNGDLTVTSDARDSNDPAVTYTGVSVYDTICYERIGDDVRDWEVLDGGDDTINEVMTVPIRKTTAQDTGVLAMWCEISPETGGVVLFDKDGTISANQRIDTCIYDDPNLDQTPDWICRVNLLDITPSADPNNIPTLNIRLKFMEDATTFNLDQTTVSIINVGTGTMDNRLKFDADMVTSNTENDSGAKALSQVQISVNATDGDDSLYDIGNSQIEIPMGNNIQRIKLSQMDESALTSQIIYKWKYDQATGQRDVASANFIVVAKGGDPEVDFPVIFQTRFTNVNDSLCVELELEYVDNFNVFSETSNDVEVVAGTVNADECVL